MSVSQHIEREQLVLYALQFLDPAENSSVRDHLADCRECRRELDRITGDLAAVALTAEMHSPPSLARQRIAKHAARERKTAATPEPVREETGGYGGVLEPETRRQPVCRGSGAMLFFGWALAVAFAASSLYLYQQHSIMQQQIADSRHHLQEAILDADRAKLVFDLLTDHTIQRTTLTKSVAGSWPTARVSYQPETGSLLFIALNMDPLPPDQVYQLWLIPTDGRDPVPCGTFTPDTHGNANIILPDLQHSINARSFAVSIEKQGGNSVPTVPYVLSSN